MVLNTWVPHRVIFFILLPTNMHAYHVCTCVCMCTYTHTRTCIHMHMHTHKIRMSHSLSLYLCIYVHVYTYIYKYTNILFRTFIYTNTLSCIHAYTSIHIGSGRRHRSLPCRRLWRLSFCLSSSLTLLSLSLNIYICIYISLYLSFHHSLSLSFSHSLALSHTLSLSDTCTHTRMHAGCFSLSHSLFSRSLACHSDTYT